MNKIRAAFRGMYMATSMVILMMPGLIKSVFSKNYLPLALRCRRLWCRMVLWGLGIRIKKTGQAPEGGPYIFIGNHRSYIDPVVLLRDVLALPVAKADVGAWPLIGYAAKVTGVLYVKRESKRSRADTLGAMGNYLKEGYSILVYPEGTTIVEPKTLPFKRGAFRLAANSGAPLVPVAIEYLDLGDSWVGDDTFVPHFIRCFGKRRTHIVLRYGQPVSGDDASELLKTCQTWIDQQIIEIRREHKVKEIENQKKEMGGPVE